MRDYKKPGSIAEAVSRQRLLTREILTIEHQLKEPGKKPRAVAEQSEEESSKAWSEYRSWKAKARKSLHFKKDELLFVKGWIKDRRRQIEANELGIFNPDDPRELLVKTRQALKKAIDGDATQLGSIYNVIDQFLTNAA